MSEVTINISREERDELREHAHRELDLDMSSMGLGGEDHGEARAHHVVELVALMDELGWEPVGDQERYTLGLDKERLNRLFCEFGNYASEVYADDSRAHGRYGPGQIPADEFPEGWTEAECRANLADRVESARHSLMAVDRVRQRLLGRLPALEPEKVGAA